jgi:hypothetical protein
MISRFKIPAVVPPDSAWRGQASGSAANEFRAAPAKREQRHPVAAHVTIGEQQSDVGPSSRSCGLFAAGIMVAREASTRAAASSASLPETLLRPAKAAVVC